MVFSVIRVVTWVSAALLVIGFFGAGVPVADSFAQFRHVFVMVAVVGAAVTGLFGWWRAAGVACVTVAAALLLSYPHLPGSGPPADGGGTYKLIQFNVRIHNDREAEAAQWIVSEKPDVVMLQEVLDETHPSFRLLDPILPYRVRCTSSGFGEVAVYTRFPEIIQHCGKGDGLAWINVDMNGRPVTFASLHLKWPWPGGQWQQLDQLRPVFETMKQPVVLAGDHNAVPWSATVKTVESLTKSSVIPGYRTSFWPDVLHNGKPWGALPIDHVLLPDGLVARSVRVGPTLGSDHAPVIVAFDVVE